LRRATKSKLMIFVGGHFVWNYNYCRLRSIFFWVLPGGRLILHWLWSQYQ